MDMRTLTAQELSAVSGGMAIDDAATVGAGAGAFGAIMAGATSTLLIGAAATAGGLVGASWGVGWMIGTAIYEKISS